MVINHAKKLKLSSVLKKKKTFFLKQTKKKISNKLKHFPQKYFWFFSLEIYTKWEEKRKNQGGKNGIR